MKDIIKSCLCATAGFTIGTSITLSAALAGGIEITSKWVWSHVALLVGIWLVIAATYWVAQRLGRKRDKA